MDAQVTTNAKVENKNNIDELLPYVGKYYKSQDCYFKINILEYDDYVYKSQDWALKGEKVYFSNCLFQIKYNQSFTPEFDILHRNAEEISKEEYIEIKEKIKPIYTKFIGSYQNGFDGFMLPPFNTEVVKMTKLQLRTLIDNCKNIRNYLVYHYVTEGAVRLEKLTVKTGKIINTETYQITYQNKRFGFENEIWLEFFDCLQPNKHDISLGDYGDDIKNDVWVISWNHFAKIKNIIKNPLQYLI